MIPTGHGDLQTGPWFPVAWRPDAHTPVQDRRPALGLRELLEHAHEISSLEISSPPALSGFYRILCALAARVSGLDGREIRGWEARRDKLIDDGRFDPDEIADYFARYPGRFDLFDPQRPFLQDPRLADQCPKSAGVNKLVAGRAAGNNHSWFGHHSDTAPRPVPAAQAFLDLVTWLYYGASGRCSAREVAGRSDANTKAGPLRSALSYHPVGASLFETLLAGIPQPEAWLTDAADPCPWEREQLPDPDRPELVEVRGICSQLTARAQHALLLVPNADQTVVLDAYITWAFRGPAAVPSPPDPYLIWQISKAGNPYPRRADAGRALWRDLDSLAFHEGSGSNEPRQPWVIAYQPEFDTGLRVQALGFDQDGQAKDTQFVAGTTPPTFDTALLRAHGEKHLPIGDLHLAAEIAGDRLGKATRIAWASYTGEKIRECAWSEHAAALYWPAAEERFWHRLEIGEIDGARRAFRLLAEQVFNQVTETATVHQRGARAVEGARFELYGGRPKKPTTTAKKKEQPVNETTEPSAAQLARRAFIRTVIAMCQDPGTRATLRLGLGKPLDRVPKKAHKHIVDAGLPETDDEQRQHAYYAIASMIAAVPRSVPLHIGLRDSGPRRNLGRALADAVERGDLREKSAEEAIGLLAKQSINGLHQHLPALVGRLTDRPGAIDWEALLADLEAWPTEHDQISRRWLQHYYQTRHRAALGTAETADDTQPAA